MKIGKITRRISLFLGFILVTLIALAIIIPNLYEDELKQILKEQVNQRVKAELDFDDLNLSLLSSFPDFRLNLSGPQLIGIEAFDGMNLFEATDLKLDLDFGSLIRDRKNIVINEIHSEKPVLKLLTNAAGMSNWDIMRNETSSSTQGETDQFNLRIDDIRFSAGQFDYIDLQNNSHVILEKIDLSSTGNFNPEGFDMDTKLESPSISFSQNGVIYLNQAKGIGDITLRVNLEQNKFDVEKGSFRLNALPLYINGFLDINPLDMEVDMTFKAASSDVKNFVSLMPYAYTSTFKDIQSAGILSLEGILRGTFDAHNKKYPRFWMGLKIDDGRIKFPELPLPITDINTDIQLESMDDRFEQLKISSEQFSFKVDNQPVDGHVEYWRSPSSNLYAGSLRSNMELQSLTKAYPLPQFESLSGQLNADIQYRFTEDQINNQEFENVEFEGMAEILQLKADLNDFPALTVDRLTVNSNPKEINSMANNLLLGESEITTAKLVVSDPLALFIDDGMIAVQGNITGTRFFADEWMNFDSTTYESSNDTIALTIPEYLSGNIQFDLDELHVSDYLIQNVNGALDYTKNRVKINNLDGILDQSDFGLKGTLHHINEWLAKKDNLKGELELRSENLVIDDLMLESEEHHEVGDTQELRPIVNVLPTDMELTIIPIIQNLAFKDAKWSEVRGQVDLVDRALELHNMTSKLFGGTMNFEGIYDENQINPTFSLKYDASHLKFQNVFKSFTIMQKLAPIAQFIDGVFNTNLILEGELTDGYLPVWDKLKAAGFLETLEGVVDGFKPLKEVADLLQIKAFEKMSLKDSKNWFEVIDGRVAVKEFTRRLDDIDLRVSGNHAIDNEFDYVIFAAIPRDKFKEIPGGDEVNRGLDWVNEEASRLGMDLNAGDFVNVRIHLTGHILDPKVEMKLVDISGKSLKESLKDKVVEEVKELKDSVQQEAEERVEEVKDTITTKVEEEVKQAEERIESGATKIVDTLTAKAKESAKEILDSTGRGLLEGVIDTLISPGQKEQAEDILEKEVDKVRDALKEWNPFKKKAKSDTTKKDTSKKKTDGN